MKFADAKAVMDRRAPEPGYRVAFERVEGKILASDHFPARNEPLIASEEQAWELARKFALATVGECVNIYVVDSTWSPVRSYRERMIENRK
jgi:hypothetical protein